MPGTEPVGLHSFERIPNMISIKFRLIFAALVVQSMAATAATSETPATPYSGQETRSIKALAEQEVAGLLAGQGAGLAKAAELNGYPGPAHTLELAIQLELDAGQLGATQRLMADHKARAQKLGAEVVDAERELDRLFAQKQASVAAIEIATQHAARLHARLRAEHLNTHLTQTALLNAGQVRRYNVLRGYATPDGGAAPAAANPVRHGAGHLH